MSTTRNQLRRALANRLRRLKKVEWVGYVPKAVAFPYADDPMFDDDFDYAALFDLTPEDPEFYDYFDEVTKEMKVTVRQVHEERTKFSPEQDVFPAFGVCYMGGEPVNKNGGNPRFADTLSTFGIVAVFKRGRDDEPVATSFVEAIEQALFTRLPGDAIDRCEVMESGGDLIDTSTDGQALTHVIYTVTVQWCNDNLEQNNGM